jgi:hypothetical protein
MFVSSLRIPQNLEFRQTSMLVRRGSLTFLSRRFPAGLFIMFFLYCFQYSSLAFILFWNTPQNKNSVNLNSILGKQKFGLS